MLSFGREPVKQCLHKKPSYAPCPLSTAKSRQSHKIQTKITKLNDRTARRSVENSLCHKDPEENAEKNPEKNTGIRPIHQSDRGKTFSGTSNGLDWCTSHD